MKSWLILPALVSLAGCPTTEDSKPDDSNQPQETGEPDTPSPVIFIQPSSLEYGNVDAGADLTATLTIWNTGRGELILSATTIDTADGPFTISDYPLLQIPSGDSDEMQITFAPLSAGDESATLLVDSNDPDTPSLEVPLTGTGVAPTIQLTSSADDLGQTWTGCEGWALLTVENTGNADLTVSEVVLSGAESGFTFALNEEHNGALPWVLAPGQDEYLGTLTYLPLDEGEDQATLTVTSDDPLFPQSTLTVAASGAVFESITDTFTIEDKPLDILFATDRSGSMTDDLSIVAAGLDGMLSALAAAGADYRLSMVAEDSGCINGPDLWIDADFTGDVAATTATWLNEAAGAGLYSEHAFTQWETALQASALGAGGCNEGLVRDEATLHLVGISDEPEQSPGDWSTYVANLQAMKDDPAEVVFHGIGGSPSDTCTLYYRGVWEAAEATGGTWVSICSFSSADMTTLAEDILAIAWDHSSFSLSTDPVADTIQVTVDDVVQAEGWSYDVETRRVLFDTSLSAGSSLLIAYDVATDCDTQRR